MTRRFTSAVAGPVERGTEFGAVHADAVRASVSAYLTLFAANAGYRGEIGPAVDALGRLALDRIDGWAPELAAEIRGIAAGAQLPASHVAAINARTEILAHLCALPDDECSTVVQLGATPIAIQNWDWYAAMADNWLEWTIPHPDGRRVTTVTEFGMVGKIGVNERGVATLFNILHHRDDGTGALGVPVHIIARRILDTADSAADGVRICTEARSLGVSASTSITLIDASSATSVELWPGGIGQVYPDDAGLLVRTNHFLTSPADTGDTWQERGSDTMERRAELNRRLAGRGGVDIDEILDVMTDHPSGICCHPRAEDSSELASATLATVNVDIAGRALRVSPGSPCAAVTVAESATASPWS